MVLFTTRFTRPQGAYRLTLNFQKKIDFQNIFTGYVDSYCGLPDVNGQISTTSFLLKCLKHVPFVGIQDENDGSPPSVQG